MEVTNHKNEERSLYDCDNFYLFLNQHRKVVEDKSSKSKSFKFVNSLVNKIKLSPWWKKVETMDAESSNNNNVSCYYVLEGNNRKPDSDYSFHPAFYIFKKVLLILQEYEKKNAFKFTDKERMLVLGNVAENFDILEEEFYNVKGSKEETDSNSQVKTK